MAVDAVTVAALMLQDQITVHPAIDLHLPGRHQHRPAADHIGPALLADGVPRGAGIADIARMADGPALRPIARIVVPGMDAARMIVPVAVPVIAMPMTGISRPAPLIVSPMGLMMPEGMALAIGMALPVGVALSIERTMAAGMAAMGMAPAALDEMRPTGVMMAPRLMMVPRLMMAPGLMPARPVMPSGAMVPPGVAMALRAGMAAGAAALLDELRAQPLPRHGLEMGRRLQHARPGVLSARCQKDEGEADDGYGEAGRGRSHDTLRQQNSTTAAAPL